MKFQGLRHAARAVLFVSLLLLPQIAWAAPAGNAMGWWRLVASFLEGCVGREGSAFTGHEAPRRLLEGIGEPSDLERRQPGHASVSKEGCQHEPAGKPACG